MQWVAVISDKKVDRSDGAYVIRASESSWLAFDPDGQPIKTTCGQGLMRFDSANRAILFVDYTM